MRSIRIIEYLNVKLKALVNTYTFNILGKGPADYPWLAVWNGNIKVNCVGNEGKL